MNFECEMAERQHLEISSEGGQTFVHFSNRDPGQQQSQGHGFTTGPWSKDPTAFRQGHSVVIRLETSQGARFLRVEGRQTTLLDHEPDLTNAETIVLKASQASSWKPMEAMKPMSPMRPMEPMKPMRPMN